ncbi:MAG TPA: lipoprotein-releasing system transmembrane subunit LolC, partial [Hellea balneolensis]|nr:lipoprotein-releasing system transmembrane subunit LolC [Hellea balneolensis]
MTTHATSSRSEKGAGPFARFERKISMRYLRARKQDGGVGLIATLSFLCIFLAIWAMIAIMSIMNGFRAETIRLTIGLDGHMYVGSASPNPTDLQIIGLRDRIRALPEVKNAFLFTQVQTFVQSANQNGPAVVTGIARDDLKDLHLVSDNIVVGGLEDFGTGHNGGDNIIIGIALADLLGVSAGDHITIYSPKIRTTPFGPRPVFKSYKVAGVFETGLQAADQYK